MLKEKVLKFNERNKLFAKGDRIVVGVSGGKDSVCLLDILNRCKEEYELSLLVVHINHCLRGEAADQDEAFVRDLAEKMGLEFYSERIDIRQVSKERRMTEEEAGRYMRYQIMQHVCMERGYRKIAIAHNQDDVAETVLFQMGCRGFLQNASILSGRSYLPREARSRSMSKPVVWTTASMRRTSRKNIHAIRSVCVYFHMSKVRSTTAPKSMWQRRRRKFRCKMRTLKNRRKKNICVLFMQTAANIIIPAKNLAKWI